MNTQKSHLRGAILVKLLFPILIGVALIALIFLGVLPSMGKIEDTQISIEQLQADLKQQQALLPIYLSLQQRKEKTLPPGIYVNEVQRLNIDDLEALPDVFESLARESEVELVSATPEVRSLQDGREMLRVDARMRGDFISFNHLLNGINEMPFVESTESLALDVTNLGHEMSLSVWLAIQ